MTNTDNLSHVGVLGMKWGRRKASDGGSGGSSGFSKPKNSKAKKDFESQKKLLAEAISKKKIRDKLDVQTMSDRQIKQVLANPAMKRKLKDYKNARDVQRVKNAAGLTLLSMYALSAFGPMIINGPGAKAYKFVQNKRYYDMANKYGGFDPEKVINAKFI